MHQIKVSILMRCKNEIHAIKETLSALQAQKKWDWELIAIDNGSTDGSLEALMQAGAKILHWNEEYIPGKVLNSLAQMCSGEVLVFNNADCIPQNELWLDHLIQPLIQKKADITFARQSAGISIHPLVRLDCEWAYGDGKNHIHWTHFFSLASSACLKTLWDLEHFREDLRYSEDIEWSWRLVQNGKKLLYVPLAHVEHRHQYNLESLGKRFRGEGRADALIFDKSPSPLLQLKQLIRLPIQWARDFYGLQKLNQLKHLPEIFKWRYVQWKFYWMGISEGKKS